MNERIRELAEQAEKYADENFKGEPTYSEAYDSKFAELIVNECAQECERIAQVYDGYHDDAGSDTASSCGDAIKELFGVEE